MQTERVKITFHLRHAGITFDLIVDRGGRSNTDWTYMFRLEDNMPEFTLEAPDSTTRIRRDDICMVVVANA